MNSLFLLVVASSLGIEVGWQPLPGGGHEYTIQIEPQMLEILKRGNDEIYSEIPPELDVRRYRLLVGTGKLARVSGRPRGATDSEHQRDARAQWPRDSKADLGDTANPALPRTTDDADLGNRPDMGQGSGTVQADNSSDNGSETPAKLQRAASPPNRLKNATYESPPETVHAKKPATDSDVTSAGELAARPWLAFVAATVFLCCSLAANIYLGWAAWDARSRYRTAMAKLRGVPAS